MYTSDPKKSTISLTVSGTVERIVTITPQVVRLTGKAGDAITKTVKVVAVENYPFTVKGVSVKNPKNIDAKLQPSSGKKGVWQIVVTNRQDHAGRYFNMITLDTDSTIQPQMRINVFGNILD